MGAENPRPSFISEGRIHPIGRTTFPCVDYFSSLLAGFFPSSDSFCRMTCTRCGRVIAAADLIICGTLSSRRQIACRCRAISGLAVQTSNVGTIRPRNLVVLRACMTAALSAASSRMASGIIEALTGKTPCSGGRRAGGTARPATTQAHVPAVCRRLRGNRVVMVVGVDALGEMPGSQE
jgi:hypothetical protein